MYDLFFILFIFLILLLILNYCRKKQIILQVSRMPLTDKCDLLNRLAEPFGFCYDPEQDVFSTRTDAWQRSFGYGKLYDLAAPSMNMVLDTEPVYFNYKKKPGSSSSGKASTESLPARRSASITLTL